MFEEQGEPGYQPEQRLQEPGGFPGGAEADGDAGKRMYCESLAFVESALLCLSSIYSFSVFYVPAFSDRLLLMYICLLSLLFYIQGIILLKVTSDNCII